MPNLFLFPTDGNFFTFTRHEPIGVCGQIIPVSWKHLCKHKCSLLQMETLLKFCLGKCICEMLLTRNFQVLKDRDYLEYCDSDSSVCDVSSLVKVQPCPSPSSVWNENKSQKFDL